jgi:hypothetical protein
MAGHDEGRDGFEHGSYLQHPFKRRVHPFKNSPAL